MSWAKVNEEKREGVIRPSGGAGQVPKPAAGMGGAIARRIARAGK